MCLFARRVSHPSEMMEELHREMLKGHLHWDDYLPTHHFGTETEIIKCFKELSIQLISHVPKYSKHDPIPDQFVSAYPRFSNPDDVPINKLKGEIRKHYRAIYQLPSGSTLRPLGREISGLGRVLNNKVLDPHRTLFYHQPPPYLPPQITRRVSTSKQAPAQLDQSGVQESEAGVKQAPRKRPHSALTMNLDTHGRIILDSERPLKLFRTTARQVVSQSQIGATPSGTPTQVSTSIGREPNNPPGSHTTALPLSASTNVPPINVAIGTHEIASDQSETIDISTPEIDAGIIDSSMGRESDIITVDSSQVTDHSYHRSYNNTSQCNTNGQLSTHHDCDSDVEIVREKFPPSRRQRHDFLSLLNRVRSRHIDRKVNKPQTRSKNVSKNESENESINRSISSDTKRTQTEIIDQPSSRSEDISVPISTVPISAVPIGTPRRYDSCGRQTVNPLKSPYRDRESSNRRSNNSNSLDDKKDNTPPSITQNIKQNIKSPLLKSPAMNSPPSLVHQNAINTVINFGDSSAQRGVHFSRLLALEVVTDLTVKRDRNTNPKSLIQMKRSLLNPKIDRLLGVVYVCRLELSDDISLDVQTHRMRRCVPGGGLRCSSEHRSSHQPNQRSNHSDSNHSGSGHSGSGQRSDDINLAGYIENGHIDCSGVVYIDECENQWTTTQSQLVGSYSWTDRTEELSLEGRESVDVRRHVQRFRVPSEIDLILWIVDHLFRIFDPSFVLGFNTFEESIGSVVINCSPFALLLLSFCSTSIVYTMESSNLY